MDEKTIAALRLIVEIKEAAKVSRTNPNVAFVDLRDLEMAASYAADALIKKAQTPPAT